MVLPTAPESTTVPAAKPKTQARPTIALVLGASIVLIGLLITTQTTIYNAQMGKPPDTDTLNRVLNVLGDVLKTFLDKQQPAS